MQSFSINVLLPDESVVAVDIYCDTLVKDVAAEATGECSINQNDLYLTFEGNLMCEDTPIVSHGITEGCEVISEFTSRYKAIQRVGRKPSKEEAYHSLLNNDPLIMDYFYAGLDINSPLSGSRPPLWTAVSNNNYNAVEELVNFDGIDLNRSGHRTLMLTPLMQSITQGFTDISELLIKRGSNLFARNSDSETALFIAAWFGDIKITKMLIEYGSDVDAMDSKWLTPLYAATCKNNIEIVLLLLEAGVSPKSPANKTVLATSIKNKNIQIAEALILHKADIDSRLDPKSETALFIAIRDDFLPGAELLLRSGAHVNAINSERQTALHIASSRNLKACELLLKCGADINLPDKGGFTPLLYASSRDNIHIVSLLITCGANMSARNNSLQTALHCACFRGYTAVVLVLLKAGANPKVTNVRGKTPHSTALERGHLETASVIPRYSRRCGIQ